MNNMRHMECRRQTRGAHVVVWHLGAVLLALSLGFTQVLPGQARATTSSAPPPVSDGPGHGVSKTTYAANDPVPGLNFNLRYFPASTSSDECKDNVCTCQTDSGEWYIQQGRCQLNIAQSPPRPSSGKPVTEEGFGLHLVNVSKHLTTGGMTVSEVEEVFAQKLGNMAEFDWFMDYSVTLHTLDLDSYITELDADGVPFFPTTWTDAADKPWYGIFVHVPHTQMVIELIANHSAILHPRQFELHSLETRISPSSHQWVESRSENATGDVLTVVSVNRAVSDVNLVESFYTEGMRTTSSMVIDTSDVSKRCYRWPASNSDVCFVQRDPRTTKGLFTPEVFETMLNSVHTTLLKGQPECALDKWLDNHYAVDNARGTVDMDYLVDFLTENSNAVMYFCMEGSLHYIVDPTGWSIQTNYNFSKLPPGCSSDTAIRGPEENAACSPGTCNPGYFV